MNDDSTLKRDAIYSGLKPFLGENDLNSALSVWDANYADVPRFNLQGFVSDLCQNGELSDQRTDIFMSLVQAMRSPLYASAQASEYSTIDKDLNKSGDNVSPAFEALMNALTTLVSAELRNDLKQVLLPKLSEHRISSIISAAIDRCLENNQPLKIFSSSADQLRTVVNLTYVSLCEIAGPVIADEMLARSVNTVSEISPEFSDSVESLL